MGYSNISHGFIMYLPTYAWESEINVVENKFKAVKVV